MTAEQREGRSAEAPAGAHNASRQDVGEVRIVGSPSESVLRYQDQLARAAAPALANFANVYQDQIFRAAAPALADFLKTYQGQLAGLTKLYGGQLASRMAPAFDQLLKNHESEMKRLTADLRAALLNQRTSLAQLVVPGLSGAFAQLNAEATNIVRATIQATVVGQHARLAQIVTPSIQGLVAGLEIQSGYLAAQRASLVRLKNPLLGMRVEQAARGWALATRPKIVASQGAGTDSLLHLGFSAQSVNSAAYLAEEVEEQSDEEPWQVARSQEIDALLGWLKDIDPKLPAKFKGAWNAVARGGPDWISQAANSGVEVLVWSLRSLAPDAEVIRWQASTGLYSSELGENGKPHRALRVRYIAHVRALPASSVELIIKAVTGTLNDLQKFKHADADSMAPSLRAALVALEYCLMMLWGGK